MKTEISEAIIMRVREFQETDLLVTFLTPSRGLIKGIAKGARKSRKRFVNSLDLFSLASLEYSVKREGGLSFLLSGKLVQANEGLRSDFGTLARASYMVELIGTLFPPGVTDRLAFDLLRDALAALSQGPKEDRLLLIFEARAMALGGYGINTEKCCVCGRAYTRKGLALFVQEKGGIACLGCRKGSALSPVMDPDCVRVLERMQKASLPDCLDAEFAEETVLTLTSVLTLHRDYRLEQRLKTARYLD